MHCFYELNSQEWTAGLKGQCIFMLNIPNLFSKAIVNFYLLCHARWASLVAQMVKNQSAMQETWVWDLGSITGSGRSSGEGHGNPLQYSCLENPRDRGAWQATVPGVTKSRTRLSAWRFHLSLLLSTMPVFLFLFKYAYLFFSHTNLPASIWCLSLSLHCFQAAKKSLSPQTVNIIIYFSSRVILFLIFNWIFN